MNKQFLLYLLMAVCLVAASCKNKASTEQTANKDSLSSFNKTTAYMASEDRDTVFFVLHQTAQSITGKLNFLAYEKDSRIGTISSGKMNGDTLFVQYNSVQEGMESDCEIALLKKDSVYILSNDFYGTDNYQYNANYTKGTFKDKRRIKFDGVVLKQVAYDSTRN